MSDQRLNAVACDHPEVEKVVDVALVEHLARVFVSSTTRIG